MVVVSYSGKEINAKLVYYGPGLSGKTTNLEQIYKSVPSNSRGKMVSMKTRTERTLFFDFLPVDLGQLGGFRTRFLLYTVPGQVYYNATRKLVLRGVDAVVFVADSERGKMKENIESLQNLRDNLKDYDLDLDKLPWVIQYNKRDLDDVYTIEELEEALNPKKVPWYEAVAFSGEGVFETFRGVGKVLLQKLSKEVKLEEKSPRIAETAENPEKATEAPARPAEAPAAAAPAPAPEVAPAAREKTPAPSAAAEPPTPRSEPISRSFTLETPPAAPETAKPATPKPAPPVEVSAGGDSEPEPTPPGGPGSGRKPETVTTGPSSSEAAAAKAPSPEERAPEPAVAAVESAASVARERFGLRDGFPSPSIPVEPVEEPRGFLSKLFGRGKKQQAPDVVQEDRSQDSRSQEIRAARVDIPLAEGTSNQGPVFIERRVQVPVTLSAEELVHGAVLRLVLEIKVEPAAGSSEKDTRAA